MSAFKARPPVGIDPTGVSEEGAAVYELIRDDIISSRLEANSRLVVAEPSSMSPNALAALAGEIEALAALIAAGYSS